MPLSLIAMIVLGAGFLILAPLFLFVVHSQRLRDQGRELSDLYGKRRVTMALIAGLLVIPGSLLLRDSLDRVTLTEVSIPVRIDDHSHRHNSKSTRSISARALSHSGSCTQVPIKSSRS